MRKWILRGLALTAAIAIAVVATGWLLVRASLPALDGEIDADGFYRHPWLGRLKFPHILTEVGRVMAGASGSRVISASRALVG